MASARLIVGGEAAKILGIGAFPWHALKAEEFPLLWWVDPYDDTLFNDNQIRGLKPELEALRRTPGLSNLERESVDAVLEIAEECLRNPVSARLLFFGD